MAKRYTEGESTYHHTVAMDTGTNNNANSYEYRTLINSSDDQELDLDDFDDDAPYTELQVSEESTPPVMPKFRTFLLNFTQYGLNFMVLLLSVEIVPAQVERLVGGASKGRTLGGMVAGGAAVTFIVSPLIGMVSDRISSRMGKRRPVMLVGTALLCGGLLGMAVSAPEINGRVGAAVSDGKNGSQSQLFGKGDDAHCEIDLVEKRCRPFRPSPSHNDTPTPAAPPGGESDDPLASNSMSGHSHGVIMPRIRDGSGDVIKEEETSGNLGLYIVFFLLVISSQATVAVPFNALVADKSHPSQRGFNSGMMGAMILLGNVSGALAGISFTRIGVIGMYSVIIAVLVVCVLVTTFSVNETQPKEQKQMEKLSCWLIFIGFWAPLKEHDFRWVFITRFLMQQGVATITGFLEYWLGDVIPLPNCWGPATAVALLLLPLLFAAAVSSIIFGIASDKTGYRKVIVAIASFMMGVGSFVLAFLGGEYAYVIAGLMAFIIGLGFGAYQSVDFALVMDVLPEDSDKAKDIAVWHQALVLPQALATPFGGVVLDGFEKVNCEMALGYVILFMMTSAYFIVSGMLVFKIRRVR